MFVEKNMDAASNLLTLKLDLVYRGLSMEEAQKLYSERTATVPPAAEKPKTIVKRKVMKGLVPASK
jgi:BarA-like signal transduction histidine kinase